MNIDDKLKRMPYTVRVGNIPGGLSEFITIQAAINYCDNETGDWTIEIYTGVNYAEGDITPGGGANITLRGLGKDRVIIQPAALPATATIVSAHTLTLENVEVNAFDATVPALRVDGGTCRGYHVELNGVGAGDAVEMRAGQLHLWDSETPIGDIDLRTAPCTLCMYDCQNIGGPIDTAAEALAHNITIIQCDLGNQGIASLATGATTLDARGNSNMGAIRNDGTSDWVVRDSDVGAANQQNAGGSITLFGGDLGNIAGHVGAVVWWIHSTLIKVPEGGDVQQALDALPAAGGEIQVGADTFALTAQIARAIDNVKIIGEGLATRFTLDGVTAVITAGAQDGWILADFDVDAGLVDIAAATNSTLHNITINGLHATVINPDVGQTNFPGQPVMRLEEIRALDPAVSDIVRVYDKIEYQAQNPTFATPQFIMEQLTRQARYMHVPINSLWTANHGGTGGGTLFPTYAEVTCAAAIGDHGLFHAPAVLLNSYVDGINWNLVDFDNMLIWAFDVSRDAGTHADIRARVQLKQANGEGILAADGMGIEIQNFAIHGEAFAAAQATVDLAVTMTALYTYRIMIVLIPNVGVYFYVNDVYRGVITAQVPTGAAAGVCYWVVSIDNGGAVGTACALRVSPIGYWNHL